MTPAFSTMSTALRAGTTGLWSIPAGTVNACRGPSSTGVGAVEFDAEQPVQDEEELILLVVLVPVKFALHDAQPHQDITDLDEGLVVPGIAGLVDQRLDVYRLQGGEQRLVADGVVGMRHGSSSPGEAADDAGSGQAAAAAAVPSRSPVTAQLLLRFGDTVFVALVEHPLLDLLAADQPRLAEHLEMLAAGRLADAELLRNEERTHPVADQVTIA